MNEKIKKLAKDQGFCCLWAFLEAHKATYTSELMKLSADAGFKFTVRAMQQQRATHRQGVPCDKLENCMKAKIRDGFIQVSRKTL